MNSIIHYNQSYGIRGTNIEDNVHLIRSIIDHSSRNRVPIGIRKWDEEQAIDRINHDYLFEELKQFGFGNNFIKWVRLLNTNSSFTIKMNNSISNKLLFKSGIRQRCSLSECL